ncbi:hypothetical protein [Hwanghaeella sp. LZ110]|uniref:hypothetical protein n=1 Tax=Hwanghaeella sp. LZ110 TaxID=3402810 RepID=UPI003B67A14A
MPVVFQSKVTPLIFSSNKAAVTLEGGNEEVVKYLYVYEFGEGHMGYVSRPFIDKIAITLAITDSCQQETIRDCLMDTANEHIEGIENASTHSGYKLEINFTPANSKDSVLIQVDPKKGKHGNHFIRLEMNPNKLGSTGLESFKAAIQHITAGALEWPMFVSSGNASRLEVAVDMYNVPTDELIWDSVVTGKSHIYLSKTGSVETVYAGLPKPTKASEQYYYNKWVESQEKGTKPNFGGVHTRVEMIKKGSTQKLNKICKIDNLMSRLLIVHPSGPPDSIDPLTWELFLDSCRLRGIPNALERLPASVAGHCKDTLNARAKLTWRPDKIWMHWPNAVKQSGLLKNGPPSLNPQHIV